MDEAELERAFYDMLMESQFWSPLQLRDYQRSQLSQLLRHARKNTRFYQDRLDGVFTALGDIDWDRWEEIPVVRRSDMIEHREAMLARELPKGHGQSGTISSSGSTGQPIQITGNSLTMLAAKANRWRAHCWHGLDWSATYVARYGHDPASAAPEGQPLGRWGPPWDEAARRGNVIKLHSDASMGENVDLLRRSGARYYSTGPKTLHVVALEAERLGIEINLHYVLSHGERMTEADRAACSRIFGAKSFEHYSSKEGAQIAYPCPVGAGLHINAESVLVEIVDAAGRAVPHGSSGRIVVTPFVSTAQPLIRYEQGDIGRFGPPCSCGRGLPVLAAVEGRTIAIFTHPDGRQIATMLDEAARIALGCSFWQIAQVGPLQFEIRYVPKNWDFVCDYATATALFRGNFFEDAEVTFVPVQDIPYTASGKYIEYVNEWARIEPRPT
jgi:phenylacetate-CoA ligase